MALIFILFQWKNCVLGLLKIKISDCKQSFSCCVEKENDACFFLQKYVGISSQFFCVKIASEFLAEEFSVLIALGSKQHFVFAAGRRTFPFFRRRGKLLPWILFSAGKSQFYQVVICSLTSALAKDRAISFVPIARKQLGFCRRKAAFFKNFSLAGAPDQNLTLSPDLKRQRGIEMEISFVD